MWKLSTSARSLPGEPCFLGFFWNFFFFPFFIGLPRGLYELLSIFDCASSDSQWEFRSWFIRGDAVGSCGRARK
jgi:hypothetical protein